MDLETDAKVQETVMREFHNKTILCIAHRLKTIINYDKILVLDEGKVAVSVAYSPLVVSDLLFRSSAPLLNYMIEVDYLQQCASEVVLVAMIL